MQSGDCAVSVLGNQPALHSIGAAKTIVQQTLEKDLSTCLMYPARNHESRGFQKVEPHTADEIIYADATILIEERSAVVFQVADCPGLILHDTKSGKVGVAHAGRPATTPYGKLEQNIISHLLQQMDYPMGSSIRSVTALITPCISPGWFRHDFHAEAKALVKRFGEWHERYPQAGIITDDAALTLDMRAFIITQLKYKYSEPKDIKVDATCTFETRGLASRRFDAHYPSEGKEPLYNTCIVYRK